MFQTTNQGIYIYMYGYIMVYSGSTQQYEMGVSGNALNIQKYDIEYMQNQWI